MIRIFLSVRNFFFMAFLFFIFWSAYEYFLKLNSDSKKIMIGEILQSTYSSRDEFLNCIENKESHELCFGLFKKNISKYRSEGVVYFFLGNNFVAINIDGGVFVTFSIKFKDERVFWECAIYPGGVGVYECDSLKVY